MVFRRELSLEWDFDNTGDGPLQAPGFGVAVDLQLPYRDRLAHGANDFKQSPPLTAKEVAMLGVMNALTDKLDWHEKILDDEIADRWGEEALAVPLMSREAWEWCLLELREKAARFQKTGRVTVLDGASRVSKSDSKVPETLNQELRVALQPLLNQPADQQDWHPGSDGQVLNLVHPSLFPLIFGKTKVLMDGGIVPLDIGSASSFENAKVSPLQPPADSLASNKFQWLPCEVEFAEDAGPDVEITSYINNLHPKHKDVYTCIEKIISLTIPAWNEVLVDGHDGRTPPRIRTYGAQFDGELPDWYKGLSLADKKRKSEPEVYKEARRKVAAFCKFKDLDEEDEELKDDDEIDIEDESTSVNEDDFGPEYVEEHGLAQTVQEYSERHVRKVLHPEPGVSFTYTQWKAGLTGKGVVPSYRESYHVDSNWNGDEQRDHNYYSLRIQDDFRDEGLQVIVKLASIELTPEKPTYGGGSWHVEGLLNEHIAATALYYYDVGNIIEARISFRAETFLDEMTMQYAQSKSCKIPLQPPMLPSCH